MTISMAKQAWLLSKIVAYIERELKGIAFYEEDPLGWVIRWSGSHKEGNIEQGVFLNKKISWEELEMAIDPMMIAREFVEQYHEWEKNYQWQPKKGKENG